MAAELGDPVGPRRRVAGNAKASRRASAPQVR